MNNYLRLGAAVLAASSLSGCATVMHGTSQPVSFQTVPPGADAELISGPKCKTPCQYSLKRGKDTRVTITMEGYEPATVNIQSRTGGASLGNVLAGGLIGGIVDGTNGASNFLYPNPVYIKLAPVGSGQPAMLLKKDGTVIGTLDEYNAKVADDVNKGLKDQGYFPLSQGESAPK